jgi:hypothetical protein
MAERNTWSKQTKYDRIFRDTYWGSPDYKGEEDDECYNLKDVFQNRNKFVEDYDVKFNRNKDRCNIQGHLLFDHNELYETKFGEYIFITSPYCHEKKDSFLNLGFEEIPQLYTKSAFTMLKMFETKRSYKRFCKELNEHLRYRG